MGNINRLHSSHLFEDMNHTATQLSARSAVERGFELSARLNQINTLPPLSFAAQLMWMIVYDGSKLILLVLHTKAVATTKF